VSSYRVELTKSAKKEFDKLPARIQNKVIEALSLLKEKPLSDLLQTKRLKGALNLYRIRIGDYRIVYEVQKSRLLVLVIKVGHRREVYRHL
jgi:mRNA interferase RelE/StbE